MSSSSRCVRDARHLHRSWTVLHIVLEEAPNLSAQHCRALASATVCSFLTSWMSVGVFELAVWYKVPLPEMAQGG